MKKAIIIVIILLSCNVVKSETVRWIVQPRYDYITYFSTDIIKCVNNNHIVLLDWSGVPIMDQGLLIDSVTNFTGGYALALKKVSDGFKIVGFISEQKDHLFQRINDDYFTNQYSFFSEGLLVVSNAKGKLGYLDTNGQCVIDCKYDKARPFRKGLASVQINVSKNETRGYYINHLGQTKNPLGFHDGIIDKGSSFNDNGEAVVKRDRDYAIIDRNMKVVRTRTYDRIFPIRTYDYAYCEDYANPAPVNNQKPIVNERFVVFRNESAFGYRDLDNVVLVPAQFDEAELICNGRAIVSKDGKYGVLELIEGEFSLICSSGCGVLKVYPGMDYVDLDYEVRIPEMVDQNKLHFMIDKGDGKMDETGFKMGFKPVFKEGAKNCNLRAQLYSDDGLLLWEEKKSIDIAYVQISLSNPEPVSAYAMENGIQRIKTSVTNLSDFEIEVLPLFEVSFDGKTKNTIRSNNANELFKLLPGERKELFVGVKVVENEKVNAKISVTVDGFDCGSASSQVLLKKI